MTASIDWLEETHELHLRTEGFSYVVAVLESGALGGVHLGAPLRGGVSHRGLRTGEFHGFANRVGDPVPLEYPTAGTGDYRIPALVIQHADGSSVLDLRYVSHRIFAGKGRISGLPSTYVESDDEAASVEVLLRDDVSGIEVTLSYSVFRDVPGVARSARIRNGGTTRVRITTAMSAVQDLADADWTLVTLSGAWARERHVVERTLVPGRQSVSTTRGASSHQHNPFMLLKRAATTEDAGEAIGLSLVYSGNFVAEAEVDSFDTARVRIGINPEGFAWVLEPGDALATPEAVLVYSRNGIGGVSDAYHRLYRERLARGKWRDADRPLLVNNWEGTYFAFDEEKLVDMAIVARDLGLELFVLDDGWFGKRDDDTTSLGDWFVDRRKLPNGIDGLAKRITELGIGFGLWIEPEMVSERSELFAAHPDWAIGVPGRPRTPSRNQLVLDMGRPEIVDHLFGVLSDVLGGASISYVKWDMNRNITEPWSAALPADRQGELFHRYILGVYELYRRLTERFPDILFESCAGGGGRFDPGLLAYAPQGWTSDDTDAVERLRIQWGTSLAYPLSSMGAHVSAVPNHQVARTTSIGMRAAVAFFGVFGYELDPTAMSAEERTIVREQVAFYKQWRPVLQGGRFVRLRSPFAAGGNETAWMAVSPDERRAVVGHYRVLNRPIPGPDRLRLRGLDADANYRVAVWPATGSETERANSGVRGGDELMSAGLALGVEKAEAAARGDFAATLFTLEAE
ncbi:MAG TPA: alpha-galactosidase [Candidatus Limnocylindrales bacterium]|nr:alpha-galactosidase [Candidatus Limnocylindrales bacterium]